jgi:hypothetical protein
LTIEQTVHPSGGLGDMAAALPECPVADLAPQLRRCCRSGVLQDQQSGRRSADLYGDGSRLADGEMHEGVWPWATMSRSSVLIRSAAMLHNSPVFA